MPFIIIGIIIALVLIFGGKAIAKKAGALAKKIIKIVVLGYAYMFYMSLVVGWFADTSVFLMLLFCVLPVAVWFIRRKLTFGSRVNKQITNYINFVLNEDTTGKTILLSDFLALDTTKKLMNERKQVDDKPVSQYISQQFDQIFYSTLRSRIQEDKIDQNERIYFYWEYYKFLDYLECCNVELADCSLPRKTQKTDTQNEKNAPEHHVQERFLLPINGVLPLFYPFNFSSILATCRKICLSVSLLLVSFSVSSFGLSVVVVAFFANPFSPAALMIAG